MTFPVNDDRLFGESDEEGTSSRRGRMDPEAAASSPEKMRWFKWIVSGYPATIPAEHKDRRKKMPRFAANLTFLFTEMPFIERFAAAKRAGFEAVEFMLPYDYNQEDINIEKWSKDI